MESEQLDDLIIGHFDGTLDDPEEHELVALLQDSPEAKQRFLSFMRLEGRLHSLGRDGFLQEPEDAGDEAQADSMHERMHLEDKGVSRTRRNHARLASLIASAAVILLVFASWILSPSSVSASTVIRQAQKAAAELVDRRYRLTLAYADAGPEAPSRELDITLRGGGRFVVQPLDERYIMGSDGKDYWLTWKEGPVWVTRDFRSLAPELQRKIPDRRLLELAALPEEPLLLNLESLLALIDNRYDVELLNPEDTMLHHVRATQRSRGRGWLQSIELWSDAETGVLQQIRLNTANGRLAVFELGKTPVLSNGWYSYAEQAPERPVRRIGIQ